MASKLILQNKAAFSKDAACSVPDNRSSRCLSTTPKAVGERSSLESLHYESNSCSTRGVNSIRIRL